MGLKNKDWGEQVKKIKVFYFMIWVLLILLGELAQAQNSEIAKAHSAYVTILDRFKIQYYGTLIRRSKDEYVIKLQGPSNERNEVHVSVSQRPFVELEGTYGGRLYLDIPESERLMKNRVYVDTTMSDSLKFVREYWVVYAGMGAWECMINCYTQNAGEYYTFSLASDVSSRKPGEEVDGRKLTTEEISEELLGTMRDTSNVTVEQFNRIVGSFEIGR
ncbi:MAG TPA: hypothetical protein VLX91_08705 [Candidatus Acidoferrales bacterium]|nr:hypothetical protein [Candidatus Acidoferrales bacterium]